MKLIKFMSCLLSCMQLSKKKKRRDFRIWDLGQKEKIWKKDRSKNIKKGKRRKKLGIKGESHEKMVK